MKNIATYAAALVLSFSSAAANDSVLALQDDPNVWPIQTGDYTNTRYSELDQINRDNVGNLQVVWTFSTGVLRGHEGAPLVVGDIMYVHTPFPNYVYALDLNNYGAILWKYEPRQEPDIVAIQCCDTVYRGLAHADGMIFLHQADTTLVALDALNGAVKWSVVNGDPRIGETNSATVLPVKDKVIVGISGGEYGVRGSVTAYDIETGERVWRAYSTGPDEEMLFDPEKTLHLGQPVGRDSSLNSWEGEQWKIGGGTTWGWYSYDPELDLFYYGTGNPSTWNPVQRQGDNRWATSIIARDPDDGMAAWVYQMTPHDEWDYDGTNEMILTEQEIDGETRRVLTHFNKNGFVYTLDRASGELLGAEKFDPSVNWATHVDLDPNSPSYGRPVTVPRYSPEHNGEDVTTTEICPSNTGAKGPNPAAYSPRTGLFYVPATNTCMDYEPYRVDYTAGQPYVGAVPGVYPAQNMFGGFGSFFAWDASTGKRAWLLPERFTVWSGALATAGDVVFYGNLQGYLKAVDARTGQVLYQFRTPSGIIGDIMTYAHDGTQYVAVLSGVGGWPGIGLVSGIADDVPPREAGLSWGWFQTAMNYYTALGGSLTVFALPH